MSYGNNEDGNIMRAFFGGKIKVEDMSPQYEHAELGDGIGIGHTHGSYSQYIKQLSNRGKQGNGLIYLGRAIVINEDVASIVNATEQFNTGDVPKLLIMFYNVLNETTVKVAWENENNDVILEQRYQIPLPYSMNYNWWDTYSVYFTGPEDLDEGNYKVQISSRETVRNRQMNELSSTVEFSIEE